MRIRIVALWLLCAPLLAQQIGNNTPAAPPADPEVFASTLASAFSPQPVNTVTLKGLAKTHFGQDHTGTFSGTADKSGTLKFELDTDEGTRLETRDIGDSGATCNRTLNSQITNRIAYHNCIASINWIVPALSVAPSTSSKDSLTTENGQTQFQRRTVPPKADQQTTDLLEKLSEVRLTVDLTTMLATKCEFNIHPDEDSSKDIAIRVEYSDYHAVNGAKVPFKILRFQNNVLVMELTVETATVN